MNIPAFVINLDDSKERLAHVTDELRNAGIDFTVRRHIKWDIRAALTLEALVLLCD